MKKKYDSDVATGTNYGVALSLVRLSQYVILKIETSIIQIREPLKITTYLKR